MATDLGSVSTKKFIGGLIEKREKLMKDQSDLDDRAYKALNRIEKLFLDILTTGLFLIVASFAVQVHSGLLVYPIFMLALVLFFVAWDPFPSVYSNLRNLDWRFDLLAVETEELRHEIQLFRDSDAGREMVKRAESDVLKEKLETVQLLMLEKLPDCAGVKKSIYCIFWVCAVRHFVLCGFITFGILGHPDVDIARMMGIRNI